MISVEIPGRGRLDLRHIVLDFNGTMALDGVLLPGVEERLNTLAGTLDVYVLTADTFGTGRAACAGINCRVEILNEPMGAPEKEKFIKELGAGETVAVGNGTNDSLMLAGAALGIMVLGPEGASVKALVAADVAVTDINHGLDMLLNPKRLVATLRG
ncbi:MAG: ATPase P [Peptococcaceae bacterium]|nr:ATPase P [Peptococcaceae bacterium]